MRALVVALAIAGCRPAASEPPPTDPTGYPGALAPVDQLGPSFMARQKVVASYKGRRSSFEAVLQHTPGELLLVGLTPMGTKAFVLRQRGDEVEFESFGPVRLPFPPRYIMLDVHRTFFKGREVGPLADGEHQRQAEGERVTERWQGGKLRTRSYQRLSGSPQGQIEIDYGDGMSDGRPPPEVRFKNGWFGYELTISTLTYQAL